MFFPFYNSMNHFFPRKNESSILRSFAWLSTVRTFHLSTHGSIHSIAFTNIHYVINNITRSSYITVQYYEISLPDKKRQFLLVIPTRGNFYHDEWNVEFTHYKIN